MSLIIFGKNSQSFFFQKPVCFSIILGGERKSRLINDWSRLRFYMEYYNSKLSRFVEISPPRKIGFHQYIQKIDKSPGDRKWRILFKDEKSKELSDMGEQRDKLELRFRLKIDTEIPRDFLENRFDLRIDRAKLCDGGYTRLRSFD